MREVAEVIGENEIFMWSIDLYCPATLCSDFWIYKSWLYEGWVTILSLSEKVNW